MMPVNSPPTRVTIFCKVVDNYGDIGICWRLARQLRHDHGVAVTLWVDDLDSFRRIWPQVAVDAEVQELAGITVRHWRGQEGAFAPADVADVVIEFFAVDIPPGYITAMAQCEPRPVWLNLEGLTAEEWVEGCHTLPSMHPRLPLTKHFFFPGFSDKTGGLLREGALEAERRQFQADPAEMAAFLGRFGVTAAEMASLKVSLFCYPHAPVTQLFDAWQNGAAALTCLVPEGVATDAVRAFLDMPAVAGAVRTRAALTVRVVPFVAQTDYDRMLWACDFNFVRGEDSFVRAQWAGRPFVWHIYPQDENLHHVKLRAFLQRYSPGIESLNTVSLRWNGADPQGRNADDSHVDTWDALWLPVQADLPQLGAHAEEWQRKMLENGDLCGNLLKFAAALQQTPR